jgi:hypothetical protein
LVDFFRNVVSDWTVILCFDWSVVYQNGSQTPDTAQIEDILQMAAQMVHIQPLKRALGGNIYLELTEWKTPFALSPF